MAKKATSENLSQRVDDVLAQYADSLKDDIDEVIDTVAKNAVQALKSESADKFKNVGLSKGRYATGWTVVKEDTRLFHTATIYNKKYPGLPHLLEYPHAKRGGGYTKGTTHISKIEEQVTDELMKKIEGKI